MLLYHWLWMLNILIYTFCHNNSFIPWFQSSFCAVEQYVCLENNIMGLRDSLLWMLWYAVKYVSMLIMRFELGFWVAKWCSIVGVEHEHFWRLQCHYFLNALTCWAILLPPIMTRGDSCFWTNVRTFWCCPLVKNISLWANQTSAYTMTLWHHIPDIR